MTGISPLADARTQPGAEEAAVVLPEWQTGTPPEGVLLLGYSDHPSRAHKPPELYIWTGQTFQSLIGWYDGGVRYWIATGHRTDERKEPTPEPPPKEASGNRARLAEKAARRAARNTTTASAVGTKPKAE